MSELITITRAQAASALLTALEIPPLLTLIRAASARIERYCRRPFARMSRTDIFDGDGTNSLFLRAFPVITIASLTITNYAGEVSSVAVEDLTCNLRTGELRVKFSTTSTYNYFPMGFQNISVTYTAGFDSIPEDVQQACVQLMLWMHQVQLTNPLVVMRKIGDYEERFSTGKIEQEVPDAVRQLLSSYRLMGI